MTPSRLAAVLGPMFALACGDGSSSNSTFAVTFQACAQNGDTPLSFTVCTTDATFASEARRLMATGERRIPCFQLQNGGSCDSQWSWGIDPATPVFVDLTTPEMSACVDAVEAHKAYWVDTVGRYCPTSAVVVAVSGR